MSRGAAVACAAGGALVGISVAAVYFMGLPEWTDARRWHVC